MNRHGVPSAFQPLTGDGDSIGFSLMDFSLDLVLNKGQDMYVFVLFKQAVLNKNPKSKIMLETQISKAIGQLSFCMATMLPQHACEFGLKLEPRNIVRLWNKELHVQVQYCIVFDACFLENGRFDKVPGKWLILSVTWKLTLLTSGSWHQLPQHPLFPGVVLGIKILSVVNIGHQL